MKPEIPSDPQPSTLNQPGLFGAPDLVILDRSCPANILQFPVISRNFAPGPPAISRNFPKYRLPNITGNFAKLREITHFQPRIITRTPKLTLNLFMPCRG